MANEKLCLKDYLKCADDKKLTKTRRKVNAKSHKKRVYGVDRAYTAVDGNLAPVGGSAGGDGGAVGESVDGVGMHNGVIPGVATPAMLGGVQAAMSKREDTKKENKRNAPKKMSLGQFLRFRTRAEDEEEDLDDEMFERIKKLMDGGIDDPEDIADSLGIDVEEVQKYIDDVEGDINPDEDDDYDEVEDPEDHVDDDDMDIDDEDAGFEIDPEMDDEDMDDEEDPYDSMAAAMMGDEEDPDMDDEDFTSGIADDDEYEDFEDADPDEEDPDMDDEDLEDDDDDDMSELDFEDDERDEHDLDDEFRSDDERDDDDYDEDEEDMSPLRRAINDLGDEDEPMNDFDRFERNSRRQDDIDDFMSADQGYYDDEGGYYSDEDEFNDSQVWDDEDYTENEEDLEDDPEMDTDDEMDDYEDDDPDFDGFEKAAKDMIDSLSDETIDDIDDVTGSVAKWWREQVVARPAPAEDDFEEEQEETIGGQQTQGPPKIDRARLVFQRMINQPDSTRSDIIAAFVNEVDVTQSTAVSYYERLAKEAGITGDDDMMGGGAEQGTEMDMTAPDMGMGADMHDDLDDEVNDMDEEGDRRGIIRTVDDAHLVYKRQTEDGSFEELWVYNVGNGIKDELKIRRAILAGTDIPSNKTESEDGSQTYRLETMGNAQMLHITGLPN